MRSRSLWSLLSLLLVACAGHPRETGLRSPTGVTYTEPVVLYKGQEDPVFTRSATLPEELGRGRRSP